MLKEFKPIYTLHDYYEVRLDDDNLKITLKDIKEVVNAVKVLGAVWYTVVIKDGYTKSCAFEEQEVEIVKNSIKFKDGVIERLDCCGVASIRFGFN